MKVSIVIPIRNEELVLEKIIEQLESKLKNYRKKQRGLPWLC